jgi:hypothetical protein
MFFLACPRYSARFFRTTDGIHAIQAATAIQLLLSIAGFSIPLAIRHRSADLFHGFPVHSLLRY